MKVMATDELKITKNDSAPDGPVTVAVPATGEEFKVGAQGRKTSDPAVVEAAQNSSVLEVEANPKALEEWAKANAAYAQGRDEEQIALVREALADAGAEDIAGDPATVYEETN